MTLQKWDLLCDQAEERVEEFIKWLEQETQRIIDEKVKESLQEMVVNENGPETPPKKILPIFIYIYIYMSDLLDI